MLPQVMVSILHSKEVMRSPQMNNYAPPRPFLAQILSINHFKGGQNQHEN